MTGSANRRRSTRDWIVDSIVFVAAVLLGLWTYSDGRTDPVDPTLLALDFWSGMALCLTLWFRRRWPVQLALIAAVVSIYSDAASGPTLVLIMTVAIYKPWRTSLMVFVANAVGLLVYIQVRHKADAEAVMVAAIAIYLAVAGWGLYIRSRRQLLQTLRDRADRAETVARLQAEQAQLRAREEIAREMHDVLGHRLSLLGGAPDIRVVGEAGDGRGVQGLIDRLAPDVILMDIRMPGTDGLTATEAVRRRPGAPEVVILTTFDADEHVLRALRAGAAGFVLKDTPPGEIVDSVRRVAGGQPVLSPAVTKRLITRVAASGQDNRKAKALARLGGLNDREREIAVAVGEGKSNAEISATLYLSVPTVKTHVSRILTKLDLNNRVQVALLVHDADLQH